MFPQGKTIHAIVDNHATHKNPHKNPKVRRWFVRHPRWAFHFTPTSAYWLNAVEGLSVILAKGRLKRGAFRSVTDLQAAISRLLEEHNQQSRPCTAIQTKSSPPSNEGVKCWIRATTYISIDLAKWLKGRNMGHVPAHLIAS
jgi:transposase